MEAITIFAPHQLSLSSRTHLFPINKFSSFPLTSSCPRKPAKLVRLKATSTLSCDGRESERKFLKFPPSEWTHRFHSVTVDASEMDMLRREIDTLKPKVKNTLMSSSTKKRILMIYLLVSLGVAYHFEDEIEESLKDGFGKIEEMIADEDDLYTVSIIFWVLRTYRHNISSDVFKRFKGNNGEFKECLIGNAKGMLALYEAAHMGTTTDEILDEAMRFTTEQLELLATDKSCPSHLSRHIQNALRLSQHKNMDILVVVGYIPFYEQEEDHDETMLKFAKLNFNFMQLHYLEELKILTKWYKDNDFAAKLPPYFRHAVVENHFFLIGIFFEPKFSLKRIMGTKFFMALVLLDDTYDRYASLPEAESLTKSLERWAPDDAMERQPDYLKYLFKFLVDTYEEFEREMTLELGTSYKAEATRKEIIIYVKANLELTRWAQAGHVPNFEEYMEVGKVEVAVIFTIVCAWMAMGAMADEKVYEWLTSRPRLVEATCVFGRLVNDITGYEHDMRRGFVTGSVNCYMKQYGVSEKEATRELRKIVAKENKIINEEFLKESNVPSQILKNVMDTARTIYVCYNEGEGFTYTQGAIDEYITSLFVNKIPL